MLLAAAALALVCANSSWSHAYQALWQWRSPSALPLLQNIEQTLSELLPRLHELSDRGVVSSKDSFTVIETVRRYLPDTLAAYLRLPRYYAQMQPLADGRTASKTLLEQLQVLDASLKSVAKSAFAGDEHRFPHGFGQKLCMAAAVHCYEPPDRFVHSFPHR